MHNRSHYRVLQQVSCIAVQHTEQPFRQEFLTVSLKPQQITEESWLFSQLFILQYVTLGLPCCSCSGLYNYLIFIGTEVKNQLYSSVVGVLICHKRMLHAAAPVSIFNYLYNLCIQPALAQFHLPGRNHLGTTVFQGRYELWAGYTSSCPYLIDFVAPFIESSMVIRSLKRRNQVLNESQLTDFLLRTERNPSKFQWMFPSATTTVIAVGWLLVLNEINLCKIQRRSSAGSLCGPANLFQIRLLFLHWGIACLCSVLV